MSSPPLPPPLPNIPSPFSSPLPHKASTAIRNTRVRPACFCLFVLFFVPSKDGSAFVNSDGGKVAMHAAGTIIHENISKVRLTFDRTGEDEMN